MRKLESDRIYLQIKEFSTGEHWCTGDTMISFPDTEMLTFHETTRMFFPGYEQCKHPEVENDRLNETITVGQS